MVIVSLLLVGLYETEILTPTEMAGDATLMFGIMVASHHPGDSDGVETFQPEDDSPQVGGSEGRCPAGLGHGTHQHALSAYAHQYLYVLPDHGSNLRLYGHYPDALPLLRLSVDGKMRGRNERE